MDGITENNSYDNIMIHADGIQKRFGDNEVLKGIDLDVTPGEVIAVIGPIRLREKYNAAMSDRT